jgi:hypothetical protein
MPCRRQGAVKTRCDAALGARPFIEWRLQRTSKVAAYQVLKPCRRLNALFEAQKTEPFRTKGNMTDFVFVDGSENRRGFVIAQGVDLSDQSWSYSSSRASRTSGTTASRAAISPSVRFAASQKSSCAGRSPYAAPKSPKRFCRRSKCLLYSRETRTQPSKKDRGMFTLENRAMISSGRSIALSSICAIE